MDRVGKQWIFSPPDLVGFAGCRRLAELERLAAQGVMEDRTATTAGWKRWSSGGRCMKSDISRTSNRTGPRSLVPLEWKVILPASWRLHR